MKRKHRLPSASYEEKKQRAIKGTIQAGKRKWKEREDFFNEKRRQSAVGSSQSAVGSSQSAAGH